MSALLAVLSLAVGIGIALFVPGGAAAVVFCAFVSLGVGVVLHYIKVEKTLLIQLFVAGLLMRMIVGTLIYNFNMQEFFGGDALTYDGIAFTIMRLWETKLSYSSEVNELLGGGTGWGMVYLVIAIYTMVGRNLLAVQFFNAVLGAATAPIIYLCARHIFQSSRVARIAAFFVAFYPSLVLWSSQGLKDGPIVFLLALVMLATLKLGERFDVKFFALLIGAMMMLFSLRFYIFFMVAAAVGGAFIVGMRSLSSNNIFRQLLIVFTAGLALTYFVVLRGGGAQLEYYGNLQAVQTSRSDLAGAGSGFGRDVDVSTAGGALSTIPLGMTYLLFAPFPWQVANLRQSITLPEMIVWWASFPLLVIGVWFTLKYRLRQSLPILIFTAMLTLAYSIFQGNVGTAYRQRSQLLVFYFIFVAVGFVLLRERNEEAKQKGEAAKQLALHTARTMAAQRRYDRWKQEREQELEEIARGLSERIDF